MISARAPHGEAARPPASRRPPAAAAGPRRPPALGAPRRRRPAPPCCEPPAPGGELEIQDFGTQDAADAAAAAATANAPDAGAPAGAPLAGWRAHLRASPWDREIFALALPALASTLLDPVMGMVDVGIVGRLGTAPLAGVGLATVVYNFSNFAWNFLLYTTTPRVAGAAARGDVAAVSTITAQGLWVAGTIGAAMTALLWAGCPAIFASMGATPEVATHAVPYLRGRALASPAILCCYVLSGACRGFKDTVTPLRAGAVANAVHLALDVALVFWLRWGVVGAALATAFSHWLTAGMLLRAAAARGRLRLADLARPPTWAAVAPVLRSGLLLSTRSVLAMSMLLWSTKLIAGFGAVALASHEILRQVWVLSNQAFTSLDIATQSLVAYHLGRGERGAAAAVFRRTLTLTAGAGVAIAAALLATHAELGALFTADAAVVAQVAGVVPLLAVYMPLDAVASVMDGVLLGSQDLAWLSRTMVVTSAVTGLALLVAARAGWGIAPIWGCIKVLTLGRLVGNGWRILSPDSPIAERPAVAR